MAAGVSCAERRAELPSRGRPLGERILSTAFLDAIAKLRPEDVEAALQRHVKMERFVPVVAGDMAKAGHKPPR